MNIKTGLKGRYMARRLTGNPMVDYENGYKKGYEKAYEEAYREAGLKCIVLARHLAKLPLYNIAEEFVEDEEKQLQMIVRYAEEDDRLYADEFWNKPAKVRQALRGVKRIYEETGLNKRGYEIPKEDLEDQEDESQE